MPKYDALRETLLADGRPVIVLGFDELDDLLSGGLPASARAHRAWWANEVDGPHVQARSWAAAGYAVDAVELPTGPVTFRRT